MSSDDQVSASELRKRYARGGTAKDDELSAAQLRARHNIPGNKGAGRRELPTYD